MKVIIVGQGMWGQALYSVLVKQVKNVSFWDRSSTIQEGIVVLAIPTQAISSVVSFITPRKTLIIVNSSKGIEENTHKLPYQIILENLPDVRYFSLMGPSFAQEVLDNMPTLINLGFVHKDHAQEVKNLFQTDYFRVRLIDGVEAIETASALKNIYAILAGMSEGMGFGINTRTKIILMAFEEMSNLNHFQGHPIPQSAISGVIGDLMLTCSSSQSRNYAFGKALVEKSVEQALKESKGVVEGWHSLPAVSYFSQKTQIPLAELVMKLSQSATKKEEMKKAFLEYVKYV